MATNRKWERSTLSILQFNVLAQIWEEKNPNLKNPSDVQFVNRCSKIKQCITNAGCDVVCLQEVNPVSWYRQQFGSAFHIAFSSKADSFRLLKEEKNVADPRFFTPEFLLQHVDDSEDGAAIMFRKSTIEIIDLQRIQMYSTDDPRPLFNQNLNIHNTPKPDRQFALLAYCHHLPSGKNFLICGMHMKANGWDNLSGCAAPNDAIRVAHCQQLLKAISDYRQGRSIPLLLCGDLNAAPRDPTMDFLLRRQCTLRHPPLTVSEEGEIAKKDQAEEVSKYYQDWFDFQSAMALNNKNKEESNCSISLYGEGAEPEFTILDNIYDPKGWSSVLDYILLERGKFVPIAWLELPPLSSFVGNSALPYVGSDHIPIGVDLLIV